MHVVQSCFYCIYGDVRLQFQKVRDDLQQDVSLLAGGGARPQYRLSDRSVLKTSQLRTAAPQLLELGGL